MLIALMMIMTLIIIDSHLGHNHYDYYQTIECFILKLQTRYSH